MTHQGKDANFVRFFVFFDPWRKLPGMAPNVARRIFVPTNPDLADILGRTDLDFENLYFFYIFWIPNFQISRSPDFLNLAPGWAWAGPGQAWAIWTKQC